MGIKYSVNENFFDTWSPTMAYVLGFWYADGSLEDTPYNRGKYIRVSSTDQHIIRDIKQWMKADHKIVSIPAVLHRKQRYLLRIGSHALFNKLTERGLYPNKSLTIRFPEVPKLYLRHFVRGNFDGDGCVHVERSRGSRGQEIIKRLRVCFTSGSKNFLQELDKSLLENVPIRGSRVYASQRAFQLRYNTSDSVELFKFMYGELPPKLYFPRKFGTFQTYFSKRPQRADRGVHRTLQGAVAK